jgi:hypothetical protein
MNILRELGQAAKDTFHLERHFFVLTSVVGLAGVALGIVLMHMLATTLETALGIDPQAPIHSHPHGTLWIVLFLIGIPVTIYAGCVIVAGAFGTVMVLLGKFTGREALQYAFLSKYPAGWLKRRGTVR